MRVTFIDFWCYLYRFLVVHSGEFVEGKWANGTKMLPENESKENLESISHEIALLMAMYPRGVFFGKRTLLCSTKLYSVVRNSNVIEIDS